MGEEQKRATETTHSTSDLARKQVQTLEQSIKRLEEAKERIKRA